MDLRRATIKTVPFPEYITVLPDLADSSEFDIVVVGERSEEAYCFSLFHKIYTIEFSEIDPFFRYQCNLHKDALTWLTCLKQLIKENLESFLDSDSGNQFFKSVLLSQKRLGEFVAEVKTGSLKYSCWLKNHFNGLISFSGSFFNNSTNAARVLINLSVV